MRKIEKNLYTAVIASESIHIFCCVLPTLFSVLSLFAGMGMFVMPTFFETAHDALHAYEVPMIVVSGTILLLGWGVYAYSRRINCRTEGACAHAPCETKKDRTKLFMIAATVLFIFNVLIYFGFHRSGIVELDTHNNHAIVHNHDHHGHNH